MHYVTPSADEFRRAIERLWPQIIAGIISAVWHASGDIIPSIGMEWIAPYFVKYAFLVRGIGVVLTYRLGVSPMLAYPVAVPIIWLYFKSLFPVIHAPTTARLEAYWTVVLHVGSILLDKSPLKDDDGRIATLVGILQAMITYFSLSWLAPTPALSPGSEPAWNFWWLKFILFIVAGYFVFSLLSKTSGGLLSALASKALGLSSGRLYRMITTVGEYPFQIRARYYRFLYNMGAEDRDARQKQLQSFAPFKHASLGAGDDIRLIQLHKATYGNPPIVEIIHVSLKSPPFFVACSYVWGPPVLDRTIQVQGKSGQSYHLKVTKSAYDILCREHFVAAGKKLLWMDAICIDQQNIVEKAAQVTLMRSIYEAAAGVNVYLDASFKPFHHHWLMSQCPKMLRYIPDGHKRFIHMATIDPRDDVWREFERLFSVPWLNRAWVVQEMAVAKKLDFVYRTMHMSDDMYRDLALTLLFFQYNPEYQTSLKTRFHGEVHASLAENVPRAAKLYRLGSSPKIELRDAFRLGEPRLASDPRDKIYALLGLVTEEERRKLPIDYSISASELFTKAMREVLQQSRDLDDLSAAGLGNSESTVETPSWVARWQTSWERTDHLQHAMFSAATSQPWPGIGGSTSNEIQLPTCSVERIESLQEYSGLAERMTVKISHITPEMSREDGRLMAEFVRSRWKFALEKTSSHGQYPSQPAFRQAFWRTLFWDRVNADIRRVDATDYGKFDALEWAHGILALDEAAPLEDDERMLQGPAELNMSLEDFNDLYGAGMQEFVITVRQRLGVTQSGRLGLFPRSARVGDTVALFASANLPFVIRRAELSSDDGNRHELVGSCYVHGIMDGEAASGPWPVVTLI